MFGCWLWDRRWRAAVLSSSQLGTAAGFSAIDRWEGGGWRQLETATLQMRLPRIPPGPLVLWFDAPPSDLYSLNLIAANRNRRNRRTTMERACRMRLIKQAGTQGIAEVAVEGEIRATDFPIGANPLVELLGDGWASGALIIDFSKVSYMYSGGIGWLFDSNRASRAAGGKLVIHSLKPQVSQPLSFVGAERVLTIAPDRDAALKLAAPPV